MIIAHSLRFVQRKEDIFGTFVCHLSLSSALNYLHMVIVKKCVVNSKLN